MDRRSPNRDPSVALFVVLLLLTLLIPLSVSGGSRSCMPGRRAFVLLQGDGSYLLLPEWEADSDTAWSIDDEPGFVGCLTIFGSSIESTLLTISTRHRFLGLFECGFEHTDPRTRALLIDQFLSIIFEDRGNIPFGLDESKVRRELPVAGTSRERGVNPFSFPLSGAWLLCALGAVRTGLTAVRSRSWRGRPNACHNCGYDNSGTPGPVCPECGCTRSQPETRTPKPDSPTSSPPARRTSRPPPPATAAGTRNP